VTQAYNKTKLIYNTEFYR